jgi:3-oxoacyl-(acyl-carrier-protein) synthase
LLFPETVFNAPASHLAAVLGLTDASYTLVGDGAVAILAIQMARDLMADDAIDYCLVVGAEEADWILCDAYRKWRLVRSAPPIEPFRERARGTILSEGAGALLLARSGSIAIDKIDPGGNFARQTKTGAWTSKILSGLSANAEELVISSANGTFVDAAEETALRQNAREAIVYSPKPSLGEGVGASGVWQVIIGALAAQSGQVPPLLHSAMRTGLRTPAAATRIRARRVIVLDCGLSQQTAGLSLSVNN